MRTSRPCGANIWPKWANLIVFGAVFPHFCADKREMWHGERACGPLPRAKFHVYWGDVSPPRGEKPIFGPLSKCNTGMAVLSALRAGLPVIMPLKDYAFTLFAQFSICPDICPSVSC